MSLSEYARYRGARLYSVQAAVASGRIKKTADGRIDSEAADRAWAKNTDPAQQRQYAQSANQDRDVAQNEKPADAPKFDRNEGGNEPLQNDGGPSFQDVRVRHEILKAEKTMLVVERMKRDYVPIEVVRKAADRQARLTKAALEALPDRLAPVLAAESDSRECHNILSAEVRSVLLSLSEEDQIEADQQSDLPVEDE